MNAPDPKCSTCAYRVNELRRQSDPYQAGSTMVCLHPQITRLDCADSRRGECGEGARLWRKHAEALAQQDGGAA